MSLVPSKTFRENDELVSDLARFSEGVLTEKQIRKIMASPRRVGLGCDRRGRPHG
jgi:hypothetical protein